MGLLIMGEGRDVTAAAAVGDSTLEFVGRARWIEQTQLRRLRAPIRFPPSLYLT